MSVGAAGDREERSADAVAARVVTSLGVQAVDNARVMRSTGVGHGPGGRGAPGDGHELGTSTEVRIRRHMDDIPARRAAPLGPRVRRLSSTGVIRRADYDDDGRATNITAADMRDTTEVKGKENANLAKYGLADEVVVRVESLPAEFTGDDPIFAETDEKVNFENTYGASTWVMENNYRNSERIAKGDGRDEFYGSDVVEHQARQVQNKAPHEPLDLPQHIVRSNVQNAKAKAFIEENAKALIGKTVKRSSRLFKSLIAEVPNIRSTERMVMGMGGMITSARFVQDGKSIAIVLAVAKRKRGAKDFFKTKKRK